jgi:transcriptional regulator with XRE-family HTH domain
MKRESTSPLDSNLERFGQRLRAIRQSKKLSLAELGELAQTNLNQIGRYERGIVGPTVDILFRLAQALSVPVGALTDDAVKSIGPEETEILERLRQVEKLSTEDKLVVRRLLDAFLTSQRVKDIAAQAS